MTKKIVLSSISVLFLLLLAAAVVMVQPGEVEAEGFDLRMSELEVVAKIATILAGFAAPLAAGLSWRAARQAREATQQSRDLQERSWKIALFDKRIQVYGEIRKTLDEAVDKHTWDVPPMSLFEQGLTSEVPATRPKIFIRWLQERRRAMRPVRYLFGAEAWELVDGKIVPACRELFELAEKYRLDQANSDLLNRLENKREVLYDLFQEAEYTLGPKLRVDNE